MRISAADRRNFYALLLLFVLLAAGIGVAGRRFYLGQKRSVERSAEHELAAIADLKVRQVASWRQERRRDALVAAASATLIPSVMHVLEGTAGPDNRRQAIGWLETQREAHRYVNFFLTDRNGELILAAGKVASQREHYRELTKVAFDSGAAVITDLNAEGTDLGIHLGIVVPLGPPPFLGVLGMGIDPNQFLYPQIEAFPTPSRSGETLLVRREGDSVVYLNELRHQKNTALKLRLPLGGSSLPAARAVQGYEGVLWGNDYRGVPVAAAVKRVPNSPWFLVAKVDAAEVYAELHEWALYLEMMTLLLFAAAGAGVGWLWRRQQSSFRTLERKAETEKRALLDHFAYLSRFANDIILLSDDTGRIMEANERATAAYARTRDELLKMNMRDLRAVSTQGDFEKDWAEAHQRGSLIFETWHRSSDGRSFPVEASVRTIPVDGRIFMQSIVRDITERKRAEKSLGDALAALDAVVEASPAPIVTLDTDGKIVLWNDAAERTFGWRREEVLGKPLPMVPEEKAVESEELIRRIVGGEPIEGVELERRRRDGAAVFVRLYAAPVRGHDGRITGAMSLMLDVTEDLRAKQSLIASQERFRLSVESAPEGIFVQAGGVFRYLNPAALGLFGAGSPDEIVGRPALERVAPEFRDVVAERIRRLRDDVKPVPLIEQKFLRMDGTPFPVEVSAAPFLVEHEPGALVFFRDIGERTRAQEEHARLEDQYRQAQKLESIGRLAGGVAHDFNNHLTVINGYCDLALQQLESEHPLRSFILEVRQAGEKAAALTSQLLAFSRKQMIEAKVLDLNGIIADVEKMIGRIVGEDIQVATSLATDLGHIRADGGQISQVLMNLVVNARDAMPEGGRLVIETSNVEVDRDHAAMHAEARPGSYVLLAVTDTGIGMDDETLRAAFEPFFTTKKEGRGTGLGLSMVYGIVKQAGGWIWVSSEPNRGATFKIYLPRLDEVSEKVPESRAVSRPLGGTETVLVVEDQHEVRLLTAQVLRNHGYNILEAADGAEALQLSGDYEGEIDLMVTDVIMPGMNGRQLAEQMRAARPSLKVLYISGYTADAITHQAILDPGVDYLPKPFSPDGLASRVRSMLGEPRDL